MEPLKNIWEFILAYKMYFLGGIAGLIVSILLLTVGFFGTLLILVLTVGGAILMGSAEARAYTRAFFVQLYRWIFKRDN
ncbi:MAG: DUF2273 domain-containing protein [Christensenellaceae bacterium]|nr:DUF2273 domain-containing protein [Christensenellaceae bacterium]MBR3843704.1 DUF2273 domain-containing protein [Christensenellaceae bacterium]